MRAGGSAEEVDPPSGLFVQRPNIDPPSRNPLKSGLEYVAAMEVRRGKGLIERRDKKKWGNQFIFVA